ncbi:hypothetical protein M513_13569 [Trichuris suis]|uniref:Uncharacterized protein n=1 Tax=Trichuris suis TaxID=68888 RepID=A0A085LKQ7_9BILA|nr:hypothetical protein M513_13569 [Trichuris suis]
MRNRETVGPNGARGLCTLEGHRAQGSIIRCEPKTQHNERNEVDQGESSRTNSAGKQIRID